MLLKKIAWFWKNGLVTISRKSQKDLYAAFILILLGVTGCSNTPKTEIETVPNDSTESQISEQTDDGIAEKIAETYQDIYENAVETNTIGNLEVMRSIINRLGKNGYVAVDSKNQIDMTEAEQVIQFCEQVDAKVEAVLTIIKVSYLGGFTKYDLKTEDGNVDIVQGYYQYENGQLKNMSRGSYHADSWKYTEDGYLMFSGTWFLEELYVLTLSGAEEHAAFRVQPLDEKCRELNRQYLLPISYEQNNMFIVDWSEDDFGELNFYDLYDIFYPKVNGRIIPYAIDDNLGVGAVYRIPKDEFERVIKAYFNIGDKTLQSKTSYYSEDATYEYKPRGFYEVEYPEYPYSEVVSYTKNSDETITLTVNAVFPFEGISKVYTHEVVVRPLDNGGAQYVSNRIISSEDNYEETWHTPRLTKKEWEEIYEGTE